MIISTMRQHRGKKARIGGICFDEGRMMVFIGYHAFPDGTTGKILVNFKEARELANRIGVDKVSSRKKLVRWINRRYGE